MPPAPSSPGPWLRPEIVTLAPASAKPSAIARPMPRDDPVTIATLPDRSNNFMSRSFAPLRRPPHPNPLPPGGGGGVPERPSPPPPKKPPPAFGGGGGP